MEILSESKLPRKFRRVLSESEGLEKLRDFKDSSSELDLLFRGAVVDLKSRAYVRDLSASEVLLTIGGGGELKLPWNPKACTFAQAEPDRGIFRLLRLEVTMQEGSVLRLVAKAEAAAP